MQKGQVRNIRMCQDCSLITFKFHDNSFKVKKGNYDNSIS